MSDESLVSGIIDRDEERVRRFVHTYQDRVYAQCFRILRNRSDAEEACQDVFLKALRSMEQFEHRCKLSTWLYRITYTTCLDTLKKQKRKAEEVSLDNTSFPGWAHLQNGLEMLQQKEQKAIVHEAIGKLKEIDGLLIHYYYMDEMSMSEIADITGLTADNVKIRIHRARQSLALQLVTMLPADTLKQFKYGKK